MDYTGAIYSNLSRRRLVNADELKRQRDEVLPKLAAKKAELGWSDHKLAAESGTIRRTWANAMQGRGVPGPGTLDKWARALGVAVELVPAKRGSQTHLPPARRKGVIRLANALRTVLARRGLRRLADIAVALDMDKSQAHYLLSGVDMRACTLLEMIESLQIKPSEFFAIYEEGQTQKIEVPLWEASPTQLELWKGAAE